jgi:hypothetical protein
MWLDRLRKTRRTLRSPHFCHDHGHINLQIHSPLSFADSDAELFRDFLKSGGGGKLPDSNIYFLKNEEAKAANFLVKGMSWLRNRNLKAGDRLYIYSGRPWRCINQDEYFY